MKTSRRKCRISAALWLASTLVAAAWAPTTAVAQGCAALDNTCEDHQPEISISPTGGTFLDSQRIFVTITWHDDRGLVASSRSITLQTSSGTISVKDSLDYVATGSLAATSSGQITLGPAGTTTTLTAEICDNATPSCGLIRSHTVFSAPTW